MKKESESGGSRASGCVWGKPRRRGADQSPTIGRACGYDGRYFDQGNGPTVYG